METLNSKITTRELRQDLSAVLGRAMYGGERIGVTRNGKLAAVVVGVEDFEMFEQYEMEIDIEAYREAKNADDGNRVSLEELKRELTN